jgi:hypothetical protein
VADAVASFTKMVTDFIVDKFGYRDAKKRQPVVR